MAKLSPNLRSSVQRQDRRQQSSPGAPMFQPSSRDDSSAGSNPTTHPTHLVTNKVASRETYGLAWFVLCICCLGVLFLFPLRMSAVQELDETRQRRVPVRAPLVWENVTDSAQYVFGVKPKHSVLERLSLVTLLPGQSVDFLVPAHELVRVQSCGGVMTEQEIQIWSSDGSGLYRKHNSAISNDGDSMIAAPDQSGICVAKVWRPETAVGPLTVAVFNSRRSPNRLLDYYQCEVIGAVDSIQIADDRAGKIRDYVPLEKNALHQIQVKGDTRLRLETRLQYGIDSEQEQTYWVRVMVDGQLHRILLFDTLPQRTNRIFVEECESLVGRREFAYVDLPAQCQTIKIESSHPIYLRADAIGLNLCRSKLNRNFNFPQWENSDQGVSFWNAPEFDPASTALSRSFLYEDTVDGFEPESITQTAVDPVWDPYINQQRIQQVARDNRVRLGGLRAYMWMRAIATRHYGDADYGDEITIPDLAQRIRERHVYFRDMLPVDWVESSNPRTVSFPIRKIRNPKQVIAQTVVGEQHASQAASRLPSTTLFRLSSTGQTNSGNPRLVYRIPKKLGNSLLRVVVDQTHMTHPTRLMVQFDNRKPIEMAALQNSPLPEQALRPSRAEAAVASLSKLHLRYDSGTVGGPFSLTREPTPVIRAATNEFLIPNQIAEVKVWVESCVEPHVYIGVQCLVSGQIELSEASYLEHRRRLKNPSYSDSDFAQRELDNNSVDLQRFIDDHWKQLLASVDDSNQVSDPDEIWDAAQIEQAVESVVSLIDSSEWPSAIESVTEIIRHSTGEQRLEAIIARGKLLDFSGEYFLAKQERLGWLRFGQGNASFKKQLLQQLIEQERNDPFGTLTVERFYSFAVQEMLDEQVQLDFANEMMANGRYRFAMLTVPDLPGNSQADEIKLRCSFQLKWWRTLDATLEQIDDPELTSFWAGMKSLHEGRYKLAYELLQASGERGAGFLRHWELGHELFGRLKSKLPAKRMAAIGDWENWQTQYPGPKVWIHESSVVSESAGAATLYSETRDLRSQFYRTTAQRSAKIQIHGPVRIRIEARPIHATGDGQPLNDLLTVTSGGQINRIPIISNNSSRALTIEGEEIKRPGQRVWSEFELSAGLNEIQIQTRTNDLLFRIHALRPEIKSSVLPPINRSSMASVMQGTFGHPVHRCNRPVENELESDCVRLVCSQRSCCSLPHSFLAMPCGCGELHSVQNAFQQLESPEFQEFRNRAFPQQVPIVNVHQDEVYRRALEVVFGQSELAVDLDDRMRRLVQLKQLVKENPHRRDLQRLLSQQLKGSTWENLGQFDSRAGVTLKPIEGWRPETPGIRIRKSLLEPYDSDYILSGLTELKLDVSDPNPTHFQITMRRPRVSFLPVGKTIAKWQVNSLTENPTLAQTGNVEIDNTDQIMSFRLTMNPGDNQLQMEQGNPLANHFLHVDVDEILANGDLVEVDSQRLRPQAQHRQYQVATVDEPLTFRIIGPAMIRIDELVTDLQGKEQILTRTETVLGSQREFSLTPDQGQEFAYYRIHKLELDAPETPIYRADYIPNVVEDPWVDSVVSAVFEEVEGHLETEAMDILALHSPDADPVSLAIFDRSQLGLQELGTLALKVGYQQRRAFEEFPTTGDADRFIETRLSRFYHDPWTNRYSQSHLIIRPRFNSGPSFGLDHQGSATLPLETCKLDSKANGWGPYQIKYRAYGFIQNTGTPLSSRVSSHPWSAGFSGSISRRHQITSRVAHQPRLSFFGRIFSEDFNGYSPGELDQDVFTRYKSEHRYGLRYSHRFTYQNCLDRRWWIRPNLLTNEDQLVPDNIGFEMGTDQLLGPLELKLGYRFTGYFADNDREVADTQSVVSLDVKLESWHNRISRSEFSFGMKHDLSDGETSLGFGLQSFFNHARGYRDFDSDAILFRSLKQERAAKHYFYN